MSAGPLEPRTEREYLFQLDNAYRERNQVVAALAKCFPSGIKKTAIEGWDKSWHGCVYIELPTGQVSWHYHDDDSDLFKNLPPYTGNWDGHSTSEKYTRLAALETTDGKRLTRLLAIRDRQATQSTMFWIRASKKALAGDPRELANRVALAEAEPLELILSDELAPMPEMSQAHKDTYGYD
jgi:hypothetical protein